MADGEVTDALDAIERAGDMSRKQQREIMQGHLDAAGQVVAEMAAMAAQGLLQRPDFTQGG